MAQDVRKPLKKFLPHLLKAKAENLNEADTVLRLINVFEEVLGYDPMEDISSEAKMKNKFVDVVLKIDGVVRLLVEAKAAGEVLRDRHIEQAQSYASRNNYHWVLLTNGTVWTLYHLTFGEGIEYNRAFSVDLADPAGLDAAAEKLALLHKQSIKRGELERFWAQSTALSPAAIAKVLFSEGLLMFLRREIRKDTDTLIDIEDLAESVHDMLSADARELIGPMKIRKKRSTTRHVAGQEQSAEAPIEAKLAPPVIPPPPIAGEKQPH